MLIQESVKIGHACTVGIAIGYACAIRIAILNICLTVIAIRYAGSVSIAIRYACAVAIAVCYSCSIVIAIRHACSIGIAIRKVSAIGITILSTGVAVPQVRVVGVGVFQSHERLGPLADLLFHARVGLKIRIELGMVAQELRVVDQRRRFANLLGSFAMAVEKLIKSRKVPARDVIAWGILPILLDSLPLLRSRSSRRLRVRGIRETQERRHRRTEYESCFRELW